MILQIETATTSCSVTLANKGQVLAYKEINQRNIHAEVITVYIDEILAQCNISYAQLDAVAVSCGPGSYTGLRIGVSTAKGLCFALDKPLIAVETLAAMAKGVAADKSLKNDVLLCPMIDARRMEVYTAIFNQAGDMIKPTAAEIIDASSFAGILAENEVMFFGDGADKCKDTLGANPKALFVPNFVNSAKYLTGIAFQKFTNSDFVDVAYFEPFYLKDFIAGKKAAG